MCFGLANMTAPATRVIDLALLIGVVTCSSAKVGRYTTQGSSVGAWFSLEEKTTVHDEVGPVMFAISRADSMLFGEHCTQFKLIDPYSRPAIFMFHCASKNALSPVLNQLSCVKADGAAFWLLK